MMGNDLIKHTVSYILLTWEFRLMKTFIVLLLYLTISSSLSASGSRGLNLNLNSLERLPEIKLSQLTNKFNYLGSTKQWHILGETLTSVSEGMPYDSTYGYKVNADKLNINNGWTLNLNDMDYYWEYVPNCPIIYLNKVELTAQVSIQKNRKNNCVTYSEKREIK